VPSNPDLLSAAVQHYQAGRLAEAEQLCEQIIAADKRHASAWQLAGIIALGTGKNDLAVTRLKRAVMLNGASPEAHNYLGLAYHFLGNIDQAANCFRQAVQQNATYAQAYNNLGNALADQGNREEAIACYQKAIELIPGYAEAYANLGTCFLQHGRPDQAVTSFQQALHLMPNSADLYSNLAGALEQLQRLDEAAACCHHALQINPNTPAAYANLGNIATDRGQLPEAIAAYRAALTVQPGYADAHFALGESLLLIGDFENGWPEYEWRPWKMIQQKSPTFLRSQWTGQPLEGKTILVSAEQGLGDVFQFIRYVKVVKDLGATVHVECPKALTKLLATCSGIDRLIPRGDELPAFDYQALLMSVPGVLKTTLETIPASVPYLFADPALIAHWHERLAAIGDFRIGINWRGRESQSSLRLRDVPLDFFVSLGELPGVRLISLQKEGRDSPFELRRDLPIADFSAELDTVAGPFMDTAAIMKNLDLVITSDTAVAHLAGALAVPVWVALPFAPNWRWLLDRSDSPWYPTMRLFRQKQIGDWGGVFEEIRDELVTEIDKRRR
jgi:tetratricopeptide (TPR) repeat protein